MKVSTPQIYPNIAQSIGITGNVILGLLVFYLVLAYLRKLIDDEAATFIYYVLAVGVPFLIAHSARKSKSGNSSFNIKPGKLHVLPLLIFATLTFGIGIVSPITSFVPISDFMKEILIEAEKNTGFFGFLTMVVAAPILEELIFRGIILEGLLLKYSPVRSILISSLLFGLVHLNLLQFVSALLGGIFMGWVYYKTRRITLTILIHASINLVGFLSHYFIDIESEINKPMEYSYGGMLNMILAIGSSVILFIVSVYFLNKEFEAEQV